MNSIPNNRDHSGLDDIENWENPNCLGMDEQSRTDFETKKDALLKYAQQTPIEEITKTTGINRQYLHYLIKRCTDVDENGKSLGFSGLIKWKHNKGRNEDLLKLGEGKPLSGSFQALLKKHPELEVTLRKLILNKIPPGSSKANHRLTWHHMHNIFMQQCTQLNITPPNYPFCSGSKGKASLINWGKKILNEDSEIGEYHPHGLVGKEPPSQCFERVEVDGHFIDVNWTVEVPGLNGEGVIKCKVSRLWFIALMECQSTAVIGYSISLGKNYSASDVAAAIRSSLVPWKPRNLSVSTVTYKSNECLPNALMPELSYVCFDELWLDNAKSHLSDLFLTVLERTVNAVPVFGPKKSPNVRPRIEQLFDLLEEAGIHCLDGTTGSNSMDPRRSNPKKDHYVLKLDTLLDLIDLMVVRYDTGISPGTTITRNEVLKRMVERETNVLRQIPISRRSRCFEYTIYDHASIGQDRGTPVVRWKNARYYGPGLTRDVVGRKVIVMAKTDVREIEIILSEDGISLGILTIERRWRKTPHSLYTRSAVRSCMTNNSYISHAADLPLAFRAHMEKEAALSATNQRILARLHQEQNHSSLVEQSESKLPMGSSVKNPAEDTPVEIRSKNENSIDEIIKKLGTTYR